MLRRIPSTNDPNLLVGAATADDAGVYRIGKSLALVQTVDFFTPIVDDPYAYGQIAAANSLSDCYAMGARPVTAMNVMGVPTDRVTPQVINTILRGGGAKVKQAGCALVGGHTIRNPEPIYGLSVTGLVDPRRMMTNAGARPGDLLILTKPLGTGIVTTGIKRGLATESLERKVISLMAKLNDVGIELAHKGLVRGATDVTGFGLLGHLGSMCRASGVGAEVFAADVPALSPEVFDLIEKDCVPGGSWTNLQFADEYTTWGAAGARQKHLLTDAQTSGGLLLCVPPKHRAAVLAALKRTSTPRPAIIGTIVRGATPRVTIR